MIAYNSSGLDNRHARRVAEEAEAEGIITAEEHSNIRSAYPDPFYTPAFFARLGFFVLTLICISFSGGFFTLVSTLGNSFGNAGFALQLLVMTGGCIAALEWLIRNRQHLASGVDDALLYSAFSCFIGSFYAMAPDIPPVLASLLAVIIATGCFIRYGDRLMALTAFFALLAFIFFSGLKFGAIGRALMPFILMSACIVVFLSLRSGRRKTTLRHYYAAFNILQVSALLCFYVAGNYFVVREANHLMSNNTSGSSAEIPLAWLFWSITIGLPVAYIAWGLKKKNRQFLVTGLVLIAGTAFTVRYYNSFLPAEWAMLIGGAVLLIVAFGCMRWLKTPRFGLTAARQGSDPFAGLSQVEALLIDETLSPATIAASPQVVFGGGSGGGGGAGGQF